jgi:hypothetical protein
MPIKRFRVSSLSDQIIPDGTGARIRIMWSADEREDMTADLTDEEAEQLAGHYNAEEVTPRPERRR